MSSDFNQKNKFFYRDLPTKSILLSVYILQGCLDGKEQEKSKKQDKNGNEQAKKITGSQKITKESQKRFCMGAQKQKLTQNKKDFTPNELTRKSF